MLVELLTLCVEIFTEALQANQAPLLQSMPSLAAVSAYHAQHLVMAISDHICL
jgi:hypothetical protein